MTPSELTVRQVSQRGEVAEWTLNPLWARLDRETHEEFGMRVFLVSRGRLAPDRRLSRRTSEKASPPRCRRRSARRGVVRPGRSFRVRNRVGGARHRPRWGANDGDRHARARPNAIRPTRGPGHPADRPPITTSCGALSRIFAAMARAAGDRNDCRCSGSDPDRVTSPVSPLGRAHAQSVPAGPDARPRAEAVAQFRQRARCRPSRSACPARGACTTSSSRMRRCRRANGNPAATV